jgi:hypothetical protein
MSNLKLHIDKPKIRKGLSYVMKTSWLTEGLDSIAFDGDVGLNYYTPTLDNITHYMLIRAHYWLPNANVDHDRFYICIGVSQSQKRKELEHIVRNDVIPQLIDWMVEVKNLPYNSPKKAGRCFIADYIEGNLIIKT